MEGSIVDGLKYAGAGLACILSAWVSSLVTSSAALCVTRLRHRAKRQ